jgi:hypothetical protein
VFLLRGSVAAIVRKVMAGTMVAHTAEPFRFQMGCSPLGIMALPAAVGGVFLAGLLFGSGAG